MEENTSAEQLEEAIKSFNPKAMLAVQKIKRPSSNLKNILLVFLTVFNEELDALVDESMAVDAE